MKSIAILAAILPSLCAALGASAQSTAPTPTFARPGETAATYTVETVLEGLDHPYGLALRSGLSKDVAAELFLIERGAGRILKMAIDHPGVTQEVIVGFPTGYPGNGYSENGNSENGGDEGSVVEGLSENHHPNRVLPLGLLFLTHSKLVVGCFIRDGIMRDGPMEDGSQILVVYRLPAKDSVLRADDMDHQAGLASTAPLAPADRPLEGGGRFCGLTKTSKAVFFTTGGASQGWILKASLEANRLTDLQTFIATKKLTGRAGPAGLTVNPQPRLPYLVVGQMGRIDVPHDSNLAFYSPRSGRLAMNISTGLHDLVGLSYSPAGNLFGIDFAWQVESDGGVYRLDDAQLATKTTCQAMKIAAARRPTSLVFAPDGALYVTALGPASADTDNQSDQKTGVLLKITGEW